MFSRPSSASQELPTSARLILDYKVYVTVSNRGGIHKNLYLVKWGENTNSHLNPDSSNYMNIVHQ